MRKGFIAWIILILSALILYIFSNETVTLALLIVLILALPASLLLLRFSSKSIEVSLSDGENLGDRSEFVLSIKNKGWLPVASVEIEAKCCNLRTGETDLYTLHRGLLPKKGAEIKIEVTPTHAGRYEVSVGSGSVSDALGVWRRSINCEAQKHLTSLPGIFGMEIPPASTAAMPEGESYSQRSKKSVVGDMTGIREYVPGDPVRNIHWKLSEKTDKLLVKELGNPFTDNYLLILDSAADISQDASALDAVASVFASLMHSLRINDMVFNAAWTDPDTGRACIKRVVTEDDYNDAVEGFLAVPATLPSAFGSIESDISDSRYARVIIVGSRIPANIDKLTNGCEATVLMYGGSQSSGGPGITVMGFDAYTYKDRLSVIEL